MGGSCGKGKWGVGANLHQEICRIVFCMKADCVLYESGTGLLVNTVRVDNSHLRRQDRVEQLPSRC
jgi:hypothetical protein